MTRLLALLLVSACAASPADLVLRGGRIRTQDPSRPLASALAARDGLLVAVGDDADVAGLVGPHTRVVELAGRTALPGLFDAHLHLAGLCEGSRRVDLVGTASEAEVVARVAERSAVTPAGAWVLGRGWDQNDWERHDFPTHAALSAAVPGHPVALWRVDGHALLANAAALELAGVDATTPDPPGGRILRDEGGRPTGVLVDAATTLVEAHVPPLSPDELRANLPLVAADLNRLGLTAVTDAGTSWQQARLYAELAREDLLPLRVHVMLDADDPVVWQDTPGLPAADLDGRGRVAVRAVKAYADGALGSRGAALLQPYADDPGQSGLLLTPPERLAALAERCLRVGWQLGTHAIGDRANRLVLDTYAAALASVPPLERAVPEPRLRIEHAQVLDAADIPRFGRLGIVASMQALHQSSDCPWAGERLGPDRERGAYAWRSLVDTGALLCGGSDAPVERPDPLAGFRAFVARPDPSGRSPDGWHPEQALTREEALAALTTWAAQASFAEDRLGRLAPGLRADVVVLSGDPLSAPVDALPGLRVELTVFDGRVVHEAGPAP